MHFKRREESKDLIFGIHAVLEAIKADKEINKIMIQAGLKGELYPKLMAELKNAGIEPQFVPVQKLNAVTQKNHQGVIAFISPVSYHKLENVIPMVFDKGETPLCLILDRITDVRNFGAICRSAECMGAHTVIVPSRGGAAINADAVKTSAGALMSLPVCREHNLKNAIEYLKDSGLQIVGCSEKATKTIEEVDLTLPTCIIMGSEEDGISPEYLKRCDEFVKIPMTGTIESLNVSVSAGILLYEVLRQRQKA